jgi:hypothetical protein
MAEILIQKNGTVSLGSVESEEDLKPRPGCNINPPPSDGRCECCGRHIKDLKPFGEQGVPSGGNFNSPYLMTKIRPAGPYDQEAENLYRVWFENCESAEEYSRRDAELVRKYGEKEVDRVTIRAETAMLTWPSRECRDCFILDDDEYFAKLRERGITFDIDD